MQIEINHDAAKFSFTSSPYYHWDTFVQFSTDCIHQLSLCGSEVNVNITSKWKECIRLLFCWDVQIMISFIFLPNIQSFSLSLSSFCLLCVYNIGLKFT